MKIMLIADDDTAIMFHMLGIESEIAEEDSSLFQKQFNRILQNSEIGVIIITEKLLIQHKDFLFPLKMNRRKPIIVEIPNMIERYEEEYVLGIIKKNIGIDFAEGAM